MAAAYRRQIQHLERCTTLLHLVDERIYDAGMLIFTHEAGLAGWLSTPERALRSRVPLEVMRTAAGRKAVAQVLLAIAHGNVL